MTIGILHDPWPHRRGPRRYRTMVEFKANPRDEAYMRELFAERYPDGRTGAVGDVPGADRVVLLFPDAIGVGWRSIEQQVAGASGVEVRVLNGRCRDFVLDAPTRRRLAARRILETLLVGEAVAAALFLLTTPFLLGWDLLRGHR